MNHDRWVITYRDAWHARLELRPSNALLEHRGRISSTPMESSGKRTGVRLAKEAAEVYVPPLPAS